MHLSLTIQIREEIRRGELLTNPQRSASNVVYVVGSVGRSVVKSQFVNVGLLIMIRLRSLRIMEEHQDKTQ